MFYFFTTGSHCSAESALHWGDLVVLFHAWQYGIIPVILIFRQRRWLLNIHLACVLSWVFGRRWFSSRLQIRSLDPEDSELISAGSECQISQMHIDVSSSYHWPMPKDVERSQMRSTTKDMKVECHVMRIFVLSNSGVGRIQTRPSSLPRPGPMKRSDSSSMHTTWALSRVSTWMWIWHCFAFFQLSTDLTWIPLVQMVRAFYWILSRVSQLVSIPLIIYCMAREILIAAEHRSTSVNTGITWSVSTFHRFHSFPCPLSPVITSSAPATQKHCTIQ